MKQFNTACRFSFRVASQRLWSFAILGGTIIGMLAGPAKLAFASTEQTQSGSDSKKAYEALKVFARAMELNFEETRLWNILNETEYPKFSPIYSQRQQVKIESNLAAKEGEELLQPALEAEYSRSHPATWKLIQEWRANVEKVRSIHWKEMKKITTLPCVSVYALRAEASSEAIKLELESFWTTLQRNPEMTPELFIKILATITLDIFLEELAKDTENVEATLIGAAPHAKSSPSCEPLGKSVLSRRSARNRELGQKIAQAILAKAWEWLEKERITNPAL